MAFLLAKKKRLSPSAYCCSYWRFPSALRLCWLSHYSLADSWIKSLQLGPLFCLKLLEERIIIAALCRWWWWFPEQQIEAYSICSEGLFECKVIIKCLSEAVLILSCLNSSGVLDSAAERWKHSLLTGEGCRLQLSAWSWVLRSKSLHY